MRSRRSGRRAEAARLAFAERGRPRNGPASIAATRRRAGGSRRSVGRGLLEHVGGEIAIAGLGSTSFERWGSALVVVLVGSPLAESGDALLETLFATAIGTAASAPVRAASLGREAGASRFLLSSEAGVARASASSSGAAEAGAMPSSASTNHAEAA